MSFVLALTLCFTSVASDQSSFDTLALAEAGQAQYAKDLQSDIERTKQAIAEKKKTANSLPDKPPEEAEKKKAAVEEANQFEKAEEERLKARQADFASKSQSLANSRNRLQQGNPGGGQGNGGGGQGNGGGGQGGGGQGGGGEGGGGAIAGALTAAAAALGPAIAAAIAADAQVKVAKIEADSAVKQTTITSDTSKYLADNQKSIAEQQAVITQLMSQENNAEQTKRLQLQLAELKDQRLDKSKADKEERAYQQELDAQRIALAREQAAENVRLAQEQLNMQITQAGISSGFSVAATKPGTSRLSATRVLSSGGSAVGASQVASSRAPTISTAGTAFMNENARGIASIKNSGEEKEGGITNSGPRNVRMNLASSASSEIDHLLVQNGFTRPTLKGYAWELFLPTLAGGSRRGRRLVLEDTAQLTKAEQNWMKSQRDVSSVADREVSRQQDSPNRQ